MTKKELFKKYSINESHSDWDTKIDNWNSVEVFRIMHNGELPNGENEKSVLYVIEFLSKQNDMQWWVKNVMSKPNWGSLYLTAKRMIYRHCELILKELKKYEKAKMP